MADDVQSAFEQLFRAHYQAVLSYALARAEPQLAKDAAAATFLVAWRRYREIPADSLGWLLGVTRRTLADERRSRDRQRAVGVRLVDEHVVESSPDPAETVARREAARAALAELSPDDAEALRLVAWEGLTNAQAAKVLGCTTAGFAVRLHRARRRFEAALAATDPIPLLTPVTEVAS